MDYSKTALVLIDIQKESDFGIKGVEAAISNSEKLVVACREKGIPIIYTRQINRADKIGLSYGEPLSNKGTPIYYSTNSDKYEVVDVIAPKDDDIIIDKYRWSAFYETSLDLILRSLGVKHVIIGGFVTDGCLMTSVFDGYFRDYQINLVKDICATSNEGAHMSSILIMANWVYGIHIYNTDQLVNKFNDQPYIAWESPGPDSLKFTPENMREVFKKLG
ncbi:cysteine hydrolase [Anaerobacillus alkaliphilus]|uniref:Cysteine hydrolase n=1 Tax=Anaerobacillus alkaliphilus TaxID=1548597 RepID=A0A4Q0VN46_9BACI|nr:isochorismatase family cysteine hydrolase [Anaerobacillus alkaliphilus]RXI96396.1 cysteine hydrolase [Anaerobacillus alkaliphilus]